MLWGPSADNSLEEGSSRRRRWRRRRRLRARKGNGEGAAPLRPSLQPTSVKAALA